VKVAVVSPYDLAAVGGVQDQVVSLVEWLRDRGHEAWAVAPGSGGPPGTAHLAGTLAWPANRSRAPIALNPVLLGRLRRELRQADVVHVHEPLMPLVGLGALLTGGVPRVGTFHADPGPVVRAVYRGGAPILRRLVRRLSVVTAVSEVARAAVRRWADARIVPNALDVGAYRPREQKVAGRVVFLGRDEPRKGLDVLLLAWPVVRAGVPGAELRVLGSERPSGPVGVTFLGRVDEERKRSELARASVLCTPNLGGESFGIVLAEGMAAGCAIVASDLAAFRSVTAGTAALVPPGDSARLAAALIGVLDDAPRAGAAAAEAALRFDRDAVFPGYLEAYREAVVSG
jgi:phosphatidylinositol alpha-mannosyltransferase